MERAISATDANQRFSELLRAVQAGDTFIVTSRGRPVAKMTPVDPLVDQKRGSEALLEYFRSLPRTHAYGWRREDLYE